MKNINKCENLLKENIYSLKPLQIQQALMVDQSTVLRIKSGERSICFDELPKMLCLSFRHYLYGIATHIAIPKNMLYSLLHLSSCLIQLHIDGLNEEETL